MIEPRINQQEVFGELASLVMNDLAYNGLNSMSDLIKRFKKNPKALEAMLFYTAYAGQTAKVLRLLEVGVNVNAVDSLNRTALMYAVVSMSFKTVKALMDAGADTSISSDNRKTVSCYAVNREMRALISGGGAKKSSVSWIKSDQRPLSGEKVIALFPAFDSAGKQTTWLAAEAVFSGRYFDPMPEFAALKPCAIESIGGWIPFPGMPG